MESNNFGVVNGLTIQRKTTITKIKPTTITALIELEFPFEREREKEVKSTLELSRHQLSPSTYLNSNVLGCFSSLPKNK